MILTRLKGGLGNQMFQYAAGLALAEQRQTVQKLDLSWFQRREDHSPHNRYGLSCFNITELFASDVDCRPYAPVKLTRSERWSVALARRLHLQEYVRHRTQQSSWHIPPESGYYEDFASLPDHTALDGYFQSERFFKPVATLLRQHFSFRYPPSDEAAVWLERIRRQTAVAVHFRRGDYVQNPVHAKTHGALGVGYYQAALRQVWRRDPTAVAFIFSDDIDAVAEEFRPEGPHEFVLLPSALPDHESLRLMSLCQHQVIANSSFSWWAGWLNPGADKMVIAPSPWLVRSAASPRDILPAGWLTVDRNAAPQPFPECP